MMIIVNNIIYSNWNALIHKYNDFSGNDNDDNIIWTYCYKKNGYDNDDSSGNITTNNNTNHFM